MRNPSAASHFPQHLREAACEAFFHSYFSHHKVRWAKRSLPWLDVGPSGDVVLSDAYDAFMAAHSRNGLLIGTSRPCSRRDYRQLLYRHYYAWAGTRRCPSRQRKKEVSLSAEEVRELAHELATPRCDGFSYVRFTTLEEAASFRPRVRALMLKSGASDSKLHEWLLAKVPALKYKPEDRAPELTAFTLQRRQILSDILAQRRPWFTRLSHRARLAVENGTASYEYLFHNAKDSHELVNVFFDPIFYSQFSFVIDAACFTDEDGDMHEHPMCYSSTGDVYPPHLVPGDPPVSRIRSIMVYAIIHKYGGLICGPDIIYTGSRLEQSRLPKDQQFQAAGIQTW